MLHMRCHCSKIGRLGRQSMAVGRLLDSTTVEEERLAAEDKSFHNLMVDSCRGQVLENWMRDELEQRLRAA